MACTGHSRRPSQSMWSHLRSTCCAGSSAKYPVHLNKLQGLLQGLGLLGMAAAPVSLKGLRNSMGSDIVEGRPRARLGCTRACTARSKSSSRSTWSRPCSTCCAGSSAKRLVRLSMSWVLLKGPESEPLLQGLEPEPMADSALVLP